MNEQSQIIPVPIEIPNSAVPIPNKSDRPDLLDKINPERVVESVRHRLMGEDFINGEWVQIPYLKDRLTPVGAWELSTLIYSASTISTSVTNFDDRLVRSRAVSIAGTAQLKMCQNWKAYGIKNTSQMETVHQIIFTNSLAVLNQRIQELLKETVTENRSIVKNEQEGTLNKIKRVIGL